METLKDLVADCRGTTGTVIETPVRTAPYTYDDFVPNVWKSGNLLGHYGVHPEADVTVVAASKEATPADTDRRIDAGDPLFAALGATLVGAIVRLEPLEPVESRALVLPAGWSDRYEIEPQCTRIAYGGPPEKPDVVHFEEEMWSENPIEPPERVAPDNPAFVDETGSYSHADVLSATNDFVEAHALDADSRIALDAPVTEPGVLLALFGTIAVTGTLELVTDDGGEYDGSATLRITEKRADADGEERVSVAELTQRLRDTRRA